MSSRNYDTGGGSRRYTTSRASTHHVDGTRHEYGTGRISSRGMYGAADASQAQAREHLDNLVHLLQSTPDAQPVTVTTTAYPARPYVSDRTRVISPAEANLYAIFRENDYGGVGMIPLADFNLGMRLLGVDTSRQEVRDIISSCKEGDAVNYRRAMSYLPESVLASFDREPSDLSSLRQQWNSYHGRTSGATYSPIRERSTVFVSSPSPGGSRTQRVTAAEDRVVSGGELESRLAKIKQNKESVTNSLRELEERLMKMKSGRSSVPASPHIPPSPLQTSQRVNVLPSTQQQITTEMASYGRRTYSPHRYSTPPRGRYVSAEPARLVPPTDDEYLTRIRDVGVRPLPRSAQENIVVVSPPGSPYQKEVLVREAQVARDMLDDYVDNVQTKLDEAIAEKDIIVSHVQEEKAALDETINSLESQLEEARGVNEEISAANERYEASMQTTVSELVNDMEVAKGETAAAIAQARASRDMVHSEMTQALEDVRELESKLEDAITKRDSILNKAQRDEEQLDEIVAYMENQVVQARSLRVTDEKGQVNEKEIAHFLQNLKNQHQDSESSYVKRLVDVIEDDVAHFRQSVVEGTMRDEMNERLSMLRENREKIRMQQVQRMWFRRTQKTAGMLLHAWKTTTDRSVRERAGIYKAVRHWKMRTVAPAFRAMKWALEERWRRDLELSKERITMEYRRAQDDLGELNRARMEDQEAAKVKILGQMISRWQKRTSAKAFVAWKMEYVDASRRKGKMAKVVVGWKNRLLARTFRSWSLEVAENVRRRNRARKFLAMMHKRSTVKTFSAWKTHVSEAKLGKMSEDAKRFHDQRQRLRDQVVNSIATHFRTGQLSRIFMAWKWRSTQKSTLHKNGRRVLLHMKNFQTASAFNWIAQCARESRRRRGLLRKSVNYFKNRALSHTFDSWNLWVKEEQRAQLEKQKQDLKQYALDMEGMLHDKYDKDMEELEAQQKQLKKRIVSSFFLRGQKRLLHRFFLLWSYSQKDEARRRQLISSIVLRMMNRTLSKAFHAWGHILTMKAEMKKKAAIVVKHWQHRFASSAFRGWHSVLEAKKRDLESAGQMRQAEEWEQLRLKYLQKISLKWLRATELKAFNAIKELTADKRQQRRKMRGAVAFFVNRQLATGFQTWWMKGVEIREARGKIRRAMMFMTKRGMAVTFRSWSQFLQDQKDIRAEERRLQMENQMREMKDEWEDIQRQQEAMLGMQESTSAAIKAKLVQRLITNEGKRITFKTFNGWLACAKRTARKKRILVKGVNMWKMRFVAKTLRSWSDYTSGVKFRRAQLRKLLQIWTGRGTAKCFRGWKTEVELRKTLAEDEMKSKLQNEHAAFKLKLANQMLQHGLSRNKETTWMLWKGYHSQKKRERQLFRKTVLHLQNRNLAVGFITWFDFKQTKQRHRVIVQRAARKWGEGTLSSCFHMMVLNAKNEIRARLDGIQQDLAQNLQLSQEEHARMMQKAAEREEKIKMKLLYQMFSENEIAVKKSVLLSWRGLMKEKESRNKVVRRMIQKWKFGSVLKTFQAWKSLFLSLSFRERHLLVISSHLLNTKLHLHPNYLRVQRCFNSIALEVHTEKRRRLMDKSMQLQYKVEDIEAALLAQREEGEEDLLATRKALEDERDRFKLKAMDKMVKRWRNDKLFKIFNGLRNMVKDKKERTERARKSLARWTMKTQSLAFEAWSEGYAQRKRGREVAFRCVQRMRMKVVAQVVHTWRDLRRARRYRAQVMGKIVAHMRNRQISKVFMAMQMEARIARERERQNESDFLRANFENQAMTAEEERAAFRRKAIRQAMLRWGGKLQARAFGAWVADAEYEKRKRARHAKAVRLFVNQTLGKGWKGWVDSILQQREDARTKARVVKRMTNFHLGRSIRKWESTAKEQRQVKVKLARAATRILKRSLVMALAAWIEMYNKARHDRLVLMRCLAKIRLKTEHKTFESWCESLAVAREQRSKVRRAVMYMVKNTLSKAYATWYDFLAEVKLNRQKLGKTLLKVQLGREATAKVFYAWDYYVSNLAKDRTHKIRNIVGIWSQRSKAKVFLTWKQVLFHKQARGMQGDLQAMQDMFQDRLYRQQGDYREKIVLKALQQFKNKTLASTFQPWKDRTMRLIKSRLKARESARKWLNQALSRAFQSWRESIAQLISRRNKMKWVSKRLMNRRVSVSFDSWRYAIIEAKENRVKLHRFLMRIMKQSLSRTFGAWVEMWKQRQHNQVVVMRSVMRILNRIVAIAFDGWLMHHEAQVDRRSKMRRALKFIQKATLAKSFNSLKDGFEERKYKRQLFAQKILRVMMGRDLLHRVFMGWAFHTASCNRGRFRKIQLVITFMSRRCLTKAFMQWKARYFWHLQRGIQGDLQSMEEQFRSKMERQNAAFREQMVLQSLQKMKNKNVALVLQGWKGVWEETKERKRKAKLAARRWFGGAISKAFQGWVGRCSSLREKKSKMLGATRHLMMLQVSKGFGKWRMTAKDRVAAKSKLRKALLSMTKRTLYRSFGGWSEWISELKRRRIIVRRSLGRIANRSVLKTFGGWQYFVAMNMERRMVIRKAVGFMTKTSQAKSFNSWVDMIDSKRHGRRVLSRVLTRIFVGRKQLMQMFMAWSHYTSGILNKRRRQHQMVIAFLSKRCVVKAFGSWKYVYTMERDSALRGELVASRERFNETLTNAQEHHRELLIRKTVRTMLNKLLAAVFNSWSTHLVDTKQRRRNAQRLAKGWMKRLEMMTMLRWKEVHAKSVSAKAKAAWVARHMLNRRLSNSFLKWCDVIQEITEKKNKLKKAVMAISRNAQFRVFQGWLESHKGSARQKLVVSRAVMRIKHRVVNQCFNSWLDFMADLKAKQAKQRRALNFVLNHAVTKTFTAWEADYRKAKEGRKRFVGTLLRVFFGRKEIQRHLYAWHHVTTSSIRGRAKKTRMVISFVSKRSLAKALLSWKSMWQSSKEMHLLGDLHNLRRQVEGATTQNALFKESLINKAVHRMSDRTVLTTFGAWHLYTCILRRGKKVAEESAKKWINHLLHSVMNSWLEGVHILRERKRKLRRAIIHLMNRKLSGAFMSIKSRRDMMRERKRKLSKAVAVFSKRTELRTFNTWAHSITQKKRNAAIMSRAAAKFSQRLLSMALDGWLEYHVAVRKRHLIAKRSALKFRNRLASMAFESWVQSIESTRAKKAVVSKALRRMMNRYVVAAFSGWLGALNAKKRKKGIVARAAKKLLNRVQAAAFSSWVTQHAEASRRKMIIKHAIEKIAHRLAYSAYEAWLDFLTTKRRNQAIAMRAMGKMRNRLLSAVFDAWVENAGDKRSKRNKQATAVKIIVNSKIARGYRKWSTTVRDTVFQRNRMQKILRHMKNRTTSRSFQKWSHSVEEERRKRSEEEAKALRVQCDNEREEGERRLEMERDEYREHIATRAVQAMKMRVVFACFNSWSTSWRRVKRRKALARRGLGMWRNRRLGTVFARWLELLDSVHSKHRAKRKALGHLLNRNISRAFVKMHRTTVAHKTARGRLKKAAAAFTRRLLVKAFNSWGVAHYSLSAKRDKLRRAVGRMRKGTAFRAFNAWVESVDTKAKRKKRILKVTHRWRNRLSHRAFDAWRSFHEHRLTKNKKAKRAIKRWVYRNCLVCFYALHDLIANKKRLADKTTTVMNMLLKRKVRGALFDWSAFVSKSRENTLKTELEKTFDLLEAKDPQVMKEKKLLATKHLGVLSDAFRCQSEKGSFRAWHTWARGEKEAEYQKLRRQLEDEMIRIKQKIRQHSQESQKVQSQQGQLVDKVKKAERKTLEVSNKANEEKEMMLIQITDLKGSLTSLEYEKENYNRQLADASLTVRNCEHHNGRQLLRSFLTRMKLMKESSALHHWAQTAKLKTLRTANERLRLQMQVKSGALNTRAGHATGIGSKLGHQQGDYPTLPVSTRGRSPRRQSPQRKTPISSRQLSPASRKRYDEVHRALHKMAVHPMNRVMRAWSQKRALSPPPRDASVSVLSVRNPNIRSDGPMTSADVSSTPLSVRKSLREREKSARTSLQFMLSKEKAERKSEREAFIREITALKKRLESTGIAPAALDAAAAASQSQQRHSGAFDRSSAPQTPMSSAGDANLRLRSSPARSRPLSPERGPVGGAVRKLAAARSGRGSLKMAASTSRYLKAATLVFSCLRRWQSAAVTRAFYAMSLRSTTPKDVVSREVARLGLLLTKEKQRRLAEQEAHRLERERLLAAAKGQNGTVDMTVSNAGKGTPVNSRQVLQRKARQTRSPTRGGMSPMKDWGLVRKLLLQWVHLPVSRAWRKLVSQEKVAGSDMIKILQTKLSTEREDRQSEREWFEEEREKLVGQVKMVCDTARKDGAGRTMHKIMARWGMASIARAFYTMKGSGAVLFDTRSMEQLKALEKEKMIWTAQRQTVSSTFKHLAAAGFNKAVTRWMRIAMNRALGFWKSIHVSDKLVSQTHLRAQVERERALKEEETRRLEESLQAERARRERELRGLEADKYRFEKVLPKKLAAQAMMKLMKKWQFTALQRSFHRLDTHAKVAASDHYHSQLRDEFKHEQFSLEDENIRYGHMFKQMRNETVVRVLTAVVEKVKHSALTRAFSKWEVFTTTDVTVGRLSHEFERQRGLGVSQDVSQLQRIQADNKLYRQSFIRFAATRFHSVITQWTRQSLGKAYNRMQIHALAPGSLQNTAPQPQPQYAMPDREKMRMVFTRLVLQSLNRAFNKWKTCGIVVKYGFERKTLLSDKLVTIISRIVRNRIFASLMKWKTLALKTGNIDSNDPEALAKVINVLIGQMNEVKGSRDAMVQQLELLQSELIDTKLMLAQAREDKDILNQTMTSSKRRKGRFMAMFSPDPKSN